MTELTAERLQECVIYNPETGVFVWAKTLGARARAGEVAGGVNHHGYWRIKLFGKLYGASRLAWLYMTGEWPKQLIDHIDGDKLNNKFANLRDVDKAVNAQNMKKAPSTNKSSGLYGASIHKDTGRWQSKIRFGGKNHHLGLFDTAQEAHQAYLAAKRAHHEGCTL